MKFDDIPQFPFAHYSITVDWAYLEENLNNWADRGNNKKMGGLIMEPDFQRGHVWTREQQIAFVEYQLMGGETGKVVIFNNPTWQDSYKEPTVLVDGKQRITAVLAFMHNEIPAFDTLFKDYEDSMRLAFGASFTIQICKMKNREEMLQLYLNINAGGTPHSDEELDRVRDLLKKERE